MKFYIVDCFAEEKYQGNELLVVIADRAISEREQQQIAREINFSETAFVLSGKRENGGYDVRIWTPNVGEVPFAGHPTLGAAYVIHHFLESGRSSLVKLNLKVGQIPVSVSNAGLTMAQNAPRFGGSVDRREIAEVFGISAEDIADDLPIQWVSTGLETVVVPLKHRATLAALKMRREAFEQYILRHPENNCNHLFFVNMGGDTIAARCLMEDFVEDPATGSANGDLAGYMLKHNVFGIPEIRYTVVQGEDMGRKSVLHIHAQYAAEQWIIEVGGQCRLVASGDWH
ncbi:MAG: PhzF family phenazine biosynthesis protein [Clostridia bacterium]|nr:PhzF family phenazine biosynthesis protein [Clostridia bacterium]